MRRSAGRGRRIVRPTRARLGGSSYTADSLDLTLTGAASGNVSLATITAGALFGAFGTGLTTVCGNLVDTNTIAWIIPGRAQLATQFLRYRVHSATITCRFFFDQRTGIGADRSPIEFVLGVVPQIATIPTTLASAEAQPHSRWVEMTQYAPAARVVSLTAGASMVFPGQSSNDPANAALFSSATLPAADWYFSAFAGFVDRGLAGTAASPQFIVDMEIKWRLTAYDRKVLTT